MEERAIFDHLMRFHSCGGCRKVFTAEGFAYMLLDNASPCCGSHEPRVIWPEPAIALFIETARSQPVSEEGHRIQLVMLAAGAEAVLYQSVFAALEGRIQDGVVAGAFMDRCQGYEGLKRAFKDLTRKSVSDALGEPYVQFLTTWAAIVKARNMIAHGQWQLKEVDHTHLLAFADQLLPAAAVLWNVAIESARPPRLDSDIEPSDE